jgi:short-subunit dehydrogenase
MKVAFLGATRGMGRALARVLAEQGAQLVLLGRDPEQLRRSAADLEVHGAAGPVAVVVCDLAKPETFSSCLEEADNALGGLDTVIVTAAQFALQEELEDDPDRLQELLTANFTNTILFCEHAKQRLLARGGGTLCVFTSVAGERARKPVILYGATKAGLQYYLAGLDHKHRAQGLKVIDVRPGFVHTGMTANLPAPPFAGTPEQVARIVARAISRGQPVVYAPRIWRLVMLGIRLLPRFVMRRIAF